MDALGNTTSFSFDGNGRKIQEVRTTAKADASGNHTAVSQVLNFQYDAADHLIKEAKLSQSGDSRVSVYSYDQFDRMIRKTLGIEHNGTMSEPQDDATYSFEAQLDAELMTSAVNGTSSINFVNETAPPFARAAFGIHASNGNPFNMQEMDFDLDRDVTGNISAVRSQGSDSSILTQAFDPAGRLIGIQVGSYKLAVGYDGFGRKNRVAGSDGVAEEIFYDTLNRTRHTIWHQGFANSVEQYLSYNAAGNVTHIAREHSRYDLTYDANDQLTNSAFTGLSGVPNYDKNFGYDPLGNAISGSRGPASFISNFLTQNGASSFVADPDGFGETIKEITGDQVKNYSYRADGKISGFQKGNLQASYHYDGLDRLVAIAFNDNGNNYTQTITYLGDTNHALLGKSGDGTITTYISGQGENERLGEVKNGVGKGYITDHLGSVLNAAPAGDWKTYGLFGEPSAKPAISPTAPPKEYAYAGYSYRREDGNYETDNRVYNPSVGRWLSQDPIGIKARDPNYYRYVLNNPLLYTDPSGMVCRRAQLVGDALVLGSLASIPFTGFVATPGAAIVACGGAALVTLGEYVDCGESNPPPPAKPKDKKIFPDLDGVDLSEKPNG